MVDDALTAGRERLSTRVVAAYSGLTLPMAALGLPIAVYLPVFYSQDLGLSLAVVGGIFTLSKVWDLLTDPVMGLLVDRYQTRWGRRKHWIVLSVPILLLSTWMVFMPNPAWVSPAYLLIWMIILYIGFTLLAITHQSWGAELTFNYDERSRLYGWREVMIIVGIVVILALPAYMEQAVEHATNGIKVASMGWFLIVLLPITTILIVKVVPDHPGPPRNPIEWRKAISLLLRNTVLRRLLLADMLSGLGTGVTGSLHIFLASFVFALPQYASGALLAYFVAGFFGMPLWLRLAWQVGKHTALIIALVYGATVLLTAFFLAGPGKAVTLWVFVVVYGIAFGAAPMLLRAMMADLTDMDELEMGEKRSGLFFALLTTTNKIGSAVSVGVAYLALELFFGFDPGAENTPGAINGVLVVYSFGAIIPFFLAGLVMYGYPLTREKHKEILDALGS
ncbi:MAG: MFS transporter [Pseudomonadales bacterium]|nr:MFS transporter [Pseudomonadales bacterium]